MKTLTAGTIAEKVKSQVTPYYLLDLGAYHLTDKPAGYVYTYTYIYSPFAFSGVRGSEASPIEAATLEVGNADNGMSASILLNSFREAAVTLREIYLDSVGDFVGIETLFVGKVEGRPACTETMASFSLAPYRNPWSVTCPRRRISKNCGWKFKDADCAYAGGATSCNKTWANCTTLSNTARFGGFRFLPERGTQFSYGTEVFRIK